MGSLSHPHVRAILEDEQGRLWVATADGLNRLDRRTGKFDRYRKDVANPQSLGDNYVMSLFQDRSGILWVDTWTPSSMK